MGQGNHSGKIAASAIRLLSAIAILGISTPSHSALASGATEEKSPAKMLGLVDKNALEHFQLQPFNISVIRDGRVTRIVSLVVTLETKGDANKTKIMTERYYLQDAFLRDMHGFASYQRADGQTIDPQVLKTRLLVISDRILGKDVVENVLVQSIFDRALP
jgi:hypothetical protein